MTNRLSISSGLFELLCTHAKAGRPIDLAGAELTATFEQAKALLAYMDGRGVLSLNQEGYTDSELVDLRLSGCEFANDN